MKRQHHRKKELSEVQELRLENRNLRAQVRDLKKQVRQLQKQEHFHENTRLDEEADQLIANEEPPPMKCPLCHRPTIKEYNVVGRHWFECEACEYDSRKNK